MQKRLNTFKLASIALVLLLLAACSKTHEKPPWEYMPNMINNPAVKAYREPGRLPVQGTIPQNFNEYPYTKEEADKAAAELKNPLLYTKGNFEKGQKMYNTYCIVCHGPKGQGDGYIVPKFPRPPTLLSDKIRDWSDGHVFHVITMGQNLMPSYQSQILPQDRWAIVLYLRAIQRATKPTPADIEAAKELLKEGKF